MTGRLYPTTTRSIRQIVCAPNTTTRTPLRPNIRHFSPSVRLNNDQNNKKKESSKNSSSDDDPSLAAGISPWARFMDVLKSEYAKSQQMQENVRELTGTAQGIKDSEAAQRMRKAYTAMRLETLIRENPKLATMAQSLSKTGKSVTEVVNKVANEIEESRLVQAAKRMTKEIDKRIGEPIRNTEAFKVVQDTVDFSQGALRYGGYIEKEERKRRRQKRLARLKNQSSTSPSPITPSATDLSSSPKQDVKQDQIVENPDAPPALVLHSTANEHQQESSEGTVNKLGSGISTIWKSVSERYEESDNPVVSTIRSMTGFIKRNVFDETETAKVIRLVKEVDADFNYDRFLVDLREFIVPDFIDSFIENDLKSLKIWTSEAAYNVSTAPMIMYLQRGLRPANEIIDLKGIDIISAKVLEERDLPVFIVGFRTHEINCYINPNKKKKIKKPSQESNKETKTSINEKEEGEGEDIGVVEVGNNEEINQVQYVIILTKEAFLNNNSPNNTSDDDETDQDQQNNKKSNSNSSHSDSNSNSNGDKKEGPNDQLNLNDITGGWKIIDLARRSTVAFL